MSCVRRNIWKWCVHNTANAAHDSCSYHQVVLCNQRGKNWSQTLLSPGSRPKLNQLDYLPAGTVRDNNKETKTCCRKLTSLHLPGDFSHDSYVAFQHPKDAPVLNQMSHCPTISRELGNVVILLLNLILHKVAELLFVFQPKNHLDISHCKRRWSASWSA